MHKSNLTATLRVKFIGTIIDSTVCMAFFPPDRTQIFLQMITMMKDLQVVSALQIQCLLGLIAVIIFDHLSMRPLHLWFMRPFKPHRQSQCCKLYPPFWRNNKQYLMEGGPFNPPKLWLTIMMNLLHYSMEVSWETHLTMEHINFQELLEVRHAYSCSKT